MSNQQDRIEEVKKILDQPIVDADGTHYINEKLKQYIATQICQLFPQPLPDDISNLINGCGAVVTQHIYHISGSQLNKLITKWKEAGKKEKSQPLTDEGLREKVDKLIADYHLERSNIHFSDERKIVVDQILALLQQREQEANNYYRNYISELLMQNKLEIEEARDTAIKAYESTCESLIVEAAKKERERIGRDIYEMLLVETGVNLKTPIVQYALNLMGQSLQGAE